MRREGQEQEAPGEGIGAGVEGQDIWDKCLGRQEERGNTVEEEGAEVREAWQEGKESEAKQPGKWGCTWGDVLPFHTLGIQLILA